MTSSPMTLLLHRLLPGSGCYHAPNPVTDADVSGLIIFKNKHTKPSERLVYLGTSQHLTPLPLPCLAVKGKLCRKILFSALNLTFGRIWTQYSVLFLFHVVHNLVLSFLSFVFSFRVVLLTVLVVLIAATCPPSPVPRCPPTKAVLLVLSVGSSAVSLCLSVSSWYRSVVPNHSSSYCFAVFGSSYLLAA